MKPLWICLLTFVIALCSCERKELETAPQGAGEVKSQGGVSLEERRTRTRDLHARAGADQSVYDSQEWFEVMDDHGPAYKAQLIECIREAESITITEHSDRVDFYEPGGPLQQNPPIFEYRTIVLTENQKYAFLRAVEEMEAATEYGSNRCGFEAHHRLTFLRDGQNVSSISICFKCGEALWSQTEFTEPKGLMDVLRSAVEGAGLEPERDWRALAKAWKKQAGNPEGAGASD
ncbi:hypothetical protein OKA04_23540 [Luteolibacter flavescens]|uniref:Lipoprotein n=1 Tax=Luteolibacter flavescens TaxID=1859460 RepID=A0ABT3FVW7_9BACT|nr:hypothetical protein [Luteolibacter flavescens]MCW1887731.1 hypothetical protein [Luteolibacter flavescens]